MRLNVHIEEQNEMQQLMDTFHEYILDEYSSLWEYKYNRSGTAPNVREIVKAVYESVYKEISDALIRRIVSKNSQLHFSKPVRELYSELFDQNFINDKVGNNQFFESLCHEVEKYFTLYQIYHRDELGNLVNIPGTEVW